MAKFKAKKRKESFGKRFRRIKLEMAQKHLSKSQKALNKIEKLSFRKDPFGIKRRKLRRIAEEEAQLSRFIYSV